MTRGCGHHHECRGNDAIGIALWIWLLGHGGGGGGGGCCESHSLIAHVPHKLMQMGYSAEE